MSTAGTCPLTVPRLVMVQRWERLTFVHWPFDPATVQRLLPAGLTVDPYEGRAWVGLVPFHMWVSAPGLPAPPWLGRFCETNVRTYVLDRHGRSGVWFFSLDATRLAAVLAGRVGWRLPYAWAQMSLTGDRGSISYETTRRWPPGPSAAGTVVVRPGVRIEPGEVTALEHHLTARWRLFAVSRRGMLRYADAEHEPWPLHRVHLDRCEDSLVRAAGLPQPDEPPIALYSPGVEVRLGRPRQVDPPI